MDSRTSTCLRLLAAAEALAVQELAQLRAGDFDGARATRQTAGPLIASVVEMAGIADKSVLARAQALVALWRRQQAWLEDELTATKGSIERIDSALHQLRRIAPVYHHSARGTAPLLSAQG